MVSVPTRSKNLECYLMCMHYSTLHWISWQGNLARFWGFILYIHITLILRNFGTIYLKRASKLADLEIWKIKNAWQLVLKDLKDSFCRYVYHWTFLSFLVDAWLFDLEISSLNLIHKIPKSRKLYSWVWWPGFTGKSIL